MRFGYLRFDSGLRGTGDPRLDPAVLLAPSPFAKTVRRFPGNSTFLISGIIGSLLGVTAGYFGGRVDIVISFIITTRLSLPVILVALASVAFVGASLTLVIVVLSLNMHGTGRSVAGVPAALPQPALPRPAPARGHRARVADATRCTCERVWCSASPDPVPLPRHALLQSTGLF